MNTEQFAKQMDRIVDSFEDRTYNKERVSLIWKEVKDLNLDEFTKICDDFIGRNSFRYPPLVPAFREAALIAKKNRLNFETNAASKSIKNKTQQGLSKYLESIGANSIMDAIFKQKLE